MKLLIKLYVFGLILVTAQHGFAQQRPVYSQYLFNALAINPAFAGSQDQFSSTAIYRDQWVNFPGAPTIQTLSANTAFAKKKIGVGFVLSNDQVGVHNNIGLYLSYAYRIKFGNGAFSMGLQAGFNNLKSDFSELNIKNLNDPNLSGLFSKFNPNFGTGVFYVNEVLYAGISIPYLLNNKVFQGDDVITQARERRNYFITAGRVFDLNEDMQIKPSTLIRMQEQAPLGLDLNLQLIFRKIISLGSSYRFGDSMIFNFELQMNENFRIGYAYEWTLSAIGDFSRGSHEIMINYRFDIPGLNRTLECPTFF